MSLINDALKRAKQAQQQSAPPATSLEFRPVEARPKAPRSQNWILITTLSVIVILAVMLVWQLMQNRHTTEAKASEPSVAAAPPVVNAPVEGLPKTEPSVAGTATTGESSSQNAPVKNSTSVSDVAVHSEGATAPGTGDTGAAVVEPAEPPKSSAALKLQSIVYNPKRPSAMISGKIVFIGDKFGEWRVAAIDQESATLVGSGLTNVLVLPQ